MKELEHLSFYVPEHCTLHKVKNYSVGYKVFVKDGEDIVGTLNYDLLGKLIKVDQSVIEHKIISSVKKFVKLNCDDKAEVEMFFNGNSTYNVFVTSSENDLFKFHFWPNGEVNICFSEGPIEYDVFKDRCLYMRF